MWFDFYLTPEAVQKFVIEKYLNIDTSVKSSIETEEAFTKVRENLQTLRWIDALDAVQIRKRPFVTALGQVSIDWFERVAQGKVVSQGLILPGSGLHLDYLDEHGIQKGFVRAAMESLLRTVEVKRKKILVSFAGEIKNKKIPFEAVMLSILFSHYASRHIDRRYLNASFKINDWCFPEYRSLQNGNSLILYLLALTEQEKCAVELLQ